MISTLGATFDFKIILILFKDSVWLVAVFAFIINTYWFHSFLPCHAIQLFRRNSHATENRNYAFHLRSKSLSARVFYAIYCGLWLNAIRKLKQLLCNALNVFHFSTLSLFFSLFVFQSNMRLSRMLITNTIAIPVLLCNSLDGFLTPADWIPHIIACLLKFSANLFML